MFRTTSKRRSSIISYIELMKTEPNLPPHMQDYLKIVSQKADRLRHMLQDIFDVSKAATGNITLMPEYIGLDKLLRQTLGDMDGVMNDSELTWRVQIPQEDFPFMLMGSACTVCSRTSLRTRHNMRLRVRVSTWNCKSRVKTPS